MAWVVHTFNVLPTDPRFREMTEEQLEWLIRSRRRLLEDSGKATSAPDEAPSYSDPDFEQWEKDVDEELEEDLRL